MGSSSFRLAACAEMLFLELPFEDRVKEISARGFDVEIWDWTKKDLDALVATGATFSSMTGYISGSLIEPTGAQELLRTADLSIQAAKTLGIQRLNIHGTGLDQNGMPVQPVTSVNGGMWIRARDTLRRLADLGQQHAVTFVLENLNAEVDHPGVPFCRAADCINLVSAIDHPNLKLNLDLYHAQIGEGNLIQLCRQALPWIGEIQVADVPGRCEPGTGEINYRNIALSLISMGYRGTIAMEAFAHDDSDTALSMFRQAFEDVS